MASYLTASIKRSYAENLLTELERNENQYFFFIGKATPWSNENSPSSYDNSIKSDYQVMNDIIGYKKLNPSNIVFALPRYEWIAGTTYDQYDDTIDLFDENNPSVFYVVTDQNNIYKCLSNNNGSPSTHKPDQVLSVPFGVTGGYVWQYLGTVRDSDLPYELTDYIPIDFAYSSVDTETTNQYNAQEQSVNGSITRLVVTNSSGGSAGTYTGAISKNTITDALSVPLRISGFTANTDGKFVTISDPTSRSRIQPVQTVIDGYIIRITDSSVNKTEIGNYAVIESVAGTSTTEYILKLKDDVIDFYLTTPSSGTVQGEVVAEIIPHIKIVGNGTGAYSYPVMNSSKQIASAVVVNGGKDYSKTFIEVTSEKTAVTNHPSIRAVVSPKGGHGSNILKELNSKDIIIIVEITEEDRQKILDGGSYRQFGIVKNPLLSSTKNLAGKENLFYRDITLSPVSGDNELSNFSGDTFNLVVGSESYSVAKILGIRSTGASTITLKTQNSSGKFITKQDRASDFLITLDASETSFQDGETVTQTIPAATIIPVLGYPQGISYGFPVTTTGTVLYSQGYTIGVRQQSNSVFLAGFTMTGKISRESKSVLGVAPSYGERVYITKLQDSLPVVVSDGEYRVVDVGVPYSDSSNLVAYSGLHVLHLTTSINTAVGAFDVTSSPLTQNSYSFGDTVHQGVTGQFGHYASGTVYRWDFESSGSGKLYLTDVLGTFKNVQNDGLTGSTLGSYIVASVTLPEIDRSSGEILYIDNVRPIQRAIGQEEEFRIRLGF